MIKTEFYKCMKFNINIKQKLSWCGEDSCDSCEHSGALLMKDLECECGEIKKTFMHNCPNTSTYDEIFGCPKCDDECGFCK